FASSSCFKNKNSNTCSPTRQCGLAFHRKCMEVCQLECEQKKGTVFGVDLSVILQDTPDEVPFVVRCCTNEIESRALSGVYRVSGSKPRIQKLERGLYI
uniref:Rho-GAP domain-containing protein n=1 Tax=Poecilia latipinna TaxID=48699 RepID=A0A3B3W2V6_9TELE